MKPLLNVAAAFAAGALAVYLLERYLSRAQGVVPLRGPYGAEGTAMPDDAELRQRVRARLGQWVSHPQAIDVDVERGVVRVGGEILAKELDGLLTQLIGLPGVRKVHNALTVLDDPSGFGEVPPAGSRSALH